MQGNAHRRPSMKANVKFGLVPLAFALLGVPVLVFVILMAAYIPPVNPTAQRNACIKNLLEIQGAKLYWAKEFHKLPTDTPTDNDIYGTNCFILHRLVCPAAGVYTIGSVGENPTCSLAAKGHVLPPEKLEKATLILVKEIVNRDGVKCLASIRVYRDGSYFLERLDPVSESHLQRSEGRISPDLVEQLQKLTSSEVVTHTNGIATYDFSPELSYITPPKAIVDLFEAVLK